MFEMAQYRALTNGGEENIEQRDQAGLRTAAGVDNPQPSGEAEHPQPALYSKSLRGALEEAADKGRGGGQ